MVPRNYGQLKQRLRVKFVLGVLGEYRVTLGAV
jgi:hypothetical protein